MDNEPNPENSNEKCNVDGTEKRAKDSDKIDTKGKITNKETDTRKPHRSRQSSLRDRDRDRERDDRDDDRYRKRRRNSFQDDDRDVDKRDRENSRGTYALKRKYDDLDNDKRQQRAKRFRSHSESDKTTKLSRDSDELVSTDRMREGPEVLRFSKAELEMRKNKHGSELSIIDRKKFNREFGPTQIAKLNLGSNIAVWEENYHIRQVFANRRPFIRPGRALALEDRLVSPTTPYSRYRRRQGEAKTVDHWGQRKLLMSEIEFLTEYGKKGCLVVYAGAAPGAHTNFLANLFPTIRFDLIDPAPFQATETDRIKIFHSTYFDDELAKKYNQEDKLEEEKDDILFISDVRSMDQTMDDTQKEKQVQIDMQRQARWHRLMKPRVSMFKFRLPYPDKARPNSEYYKDPNYISRYLKGKMYFQVWAGRTSTETRLMVLGSDIGTEDEECDYDQNHYEDICFHFNTITRTTYWEHDVKGEGLDHCYDCAGEIFILGQYLRKVRMTDESDIQKKVVELSKEISLQISNNRSLDLSKFV